MEPPERAGVAQAGTHRRRRSYRAPALGVVDGTLCLAYTGTDNRIRTRTFNDSSWSAVTVLPGGTEKAVTLGFGGDRLWLTHISQGGAVYYHDRTATTWHGPTANNLP